MSQALTVQQRKRQQMNGLIGAAQAALKSISSEENIKRMGAVLLAEGARNPKLAECTPVSFAMAVQLAGQLGLEPSGPLGHFYLIPRSNKRSRSTECSVIIGYKGLLELARRSGEIKRINANVVYRDEVKQELFEATLEPPMIKHKLAFQEISRKDEDICGAYCVVELKSGGLASVILTRHDIEQRKACAQGTDRASSPWNTNFPAQARKSAIRALMNGGTVPLSAQLQTAVAQDPEYAPIEVTQQDMVDDLKEQLKPPVERPQDPSDTRTVYDKAEGMARFVGDTIRDLPQTMRSWDMGTLADIRELAPEEAERFLVAITAESKRIDEVGA